MYHFLYACGVMELKAETLDIPEETIISTDSNLKEL